MKSRDSTSLLLFELLYLCSEPNRSICSNPWHFNINNTVKGILSSLVTKTYPNIYLVGEMMLRYDPRNERDELQIYNAGSWESYNNTIALSSMMANAFMLGKAQNLNYKSNIKSLIKFIKSYL